MNKRCIVFLLIVYLMAGCKSNIPDQKNTSKDTKSLKLVNIGEEDIKKFIRSYPVITWKMNKLKKIENKQGVENNRAKINDFVKELEYESINEFMRAWIVLATIQAKLNYKKEIKKESNKPYTSKERKKVIYNEIKMLDEYLKYGFVREDLPLVDIKLMNKYYKELEDLKITDLINGP